MELNLYSDQENSNCQTAQSLPPILSFSSMLNEHPENEQVQFWQPMSQIEFQPNSGYQPSWNHFQVYSSYEDQMIELVPVIENRAVQQISNSKRSKEKRTASINSAYNILRSHIPNVPAETKLSKIKTLKYAASYIKYLMDILENEETTPEEFCPSD